MIKRAKNLRSARDIPSLSHSQKMNSLSAKLEAIQQTKNIKSFVLLSPSQNDGKTNVAISLAINYSSRGHRVLLVNANQNDEPEFFKKEGNGQSSFSDLMASHSQSSDIQPSSLPNLSVINSLGADDFSTLQARDQFSAFLNELEKQADLIIFDGPAMDEGAQGLALATNVGSVMVLLARDHSSLKTTDMMMDDFQQTDVEVIGSIIIDR